MPKRRETILTSSGWETSLGMMDNPPSAWGFGAVTGHDAWHLVGIQLLDEVVVDLDGRRPAAGSDALHLFEREEAVLCHALAPDLQLLPEAFVDLISAAQHATDVGADLHVEPSCRLEAQHGVVAGHVAHLEFGDVDARGHFGDDRIGEVANLVLRIEQHGNQRRAADRIPEHQRVEARRQPGRKEAHGFIAHRINSLAHASAAISISSSSAPLRRRSAYLATPPTHYRSTQSPQPARPASAPCT